MASFTNPFVSVVNAMNGRPTHPVGLSKPLQQRYAAKKAAMYITMQQVLAQVTGLLADGEHIINMLPMTNERNSGMATDGVMGMYAPKTAATKRYLADQSSLRGNRLMVFTERRILFFIVIEFLDDPAAYFSYPYSHFRAIKLVEHRQKVPGDRFMKPQVIKSYSLDFQITDRNIFTEWLTEDNARLFKQNLATIPAMAGIEITDHVTRNTRWDYFVSNASLVPYYIAGLLALLLIPAFITLIWMLVTGQSL